MGKKIKYEEYGNYGKFIGGRMSGKSVLDDDELSPLEALEKLKMLSRRNANTNDLLDIIETALTEKEQQDNVLKVLKEVIEFATTLPHIKPNKDNGFNIMSGVGINIQRDIENKERELLRQWVLKTCFPKELKALEIMQRCDLKPSDITRYENYQDFIKECYLSIDGKIDDDCPSEDEFALLKEVLL